MATRVQAGGRPLSAGSQGEIDDEHGARPLFKTWQRVKRGSSRHVAEVELQKLQRQFRAMESERKAYAEESKVQLGKQRSALSLKEGNKQRDD